MQVSRFAFLSVIGLFVAGTSLSCAPVDQSLIDQIAGLTEQLNTLNEDVQSGLERPGVPGPDGPQGEEGPAGPEGPAGADGLDGVNGENGDDGKDGDDGEDGADGQVGATGFSCWDLNENGTADLETEDFNGDGVVDTLDCQGLDGQDGEDGQNGQNGQDGEDGAEGQNGADGVDGQDGADGADGQNGADGEDGQNGADGQDGADGANGQDGQDGANGEDGTDGQDGQDGADGADGQDGADGDDGYSCWDLNQNGIPDLPDEDLNADGVVDMFDCHGEDLTGVVARAVIKSDGVNATAPNNITSSLEDTGKYVLAVTMPDELDTTSLDQFDFTVVITPEAAFPFPGGPADLLMVAVERVSFEDVDSDGRNETLNLRIHIRQLPTTNYWNAGFSVVVLEP